MVPFLIIIPGILEREQEQSVVYGSIDFGKTVVTHAKYMDLLQKAGSQLKILPHTVINDKDEEVRKGPSINDVTGYSATPEMSFADFGRTYFNLVFSAFHISALA